MTSIDNNRREPKQFDAFWRHAIDELRQIPFNFQVHPLYDQQGIDEVGEFSYRGAKKEAIYGFYLKHKEGVRPTILMFHGYGWHKGEPLEYKDWYDLGMNVFAIDIRGQRGLTKDRFPYPSGDHRLMTRGLGYPEHYYLKHVYQDGLQLIQLVKTLPFVDQHKIILHGGSQGGGIVFALAGLSDVFLTFADVPSYSFFEGRIQTRNGSVREIADYVDEKKLDKKQILESLSYFDLIYFAPRIKAPLIASVGLKDDICPAVYFMKAFDLLDVDKEIYEYPNAGHEGGASTHHQVKIERLKKYLNVQ
jgi:cephalosporin-C deacetylase